MSHYSLGTYIPLPSNVDPLVANTWPTSQPRLVLPTPAILPTPAAVPTGRFYIRDILTAPAPCASSHVVGATCSLSPVSPHQLLGQPEVVAPSTLCHTTSPVQAPPVSASLLPVSPWTTQQQRNSGLQSLRQQDVACAHLAQQPQVILQQLQPRLDALPDSGMTHSRSSQLQGMSGLPTSPPHTHAHHHGDAHSFDHGHRLAQSLPAHHTHQGHHSGHHSHGHASHHVGASHHSNSTSHHHHAHHGHHGPRPERCMFTREQRLQLEEEFRLNKYITKGERNRLAGLLGLKRKQVTTWFQNRRARERRKRRSSQQMANDRDDDRHDDGEEDILERDVSMSSNDDDSDSCEDR